MWYLLLIQIISAVLGLWLADKYIPGVDFKGPFFIYPKSSAQLGEIFTTLVFVGFFIGILNYFVKPLLKKITFPLRVITFNLFTLVIAMGLIWLADVVFSELDIKGLKPLFFTTVIIWGINFILSKWWTPKTSIKPPQ